MTFWFWCTPLIWTEPAGTGHWINVDIQLKLGRYVGLNLISSLFQRVVPAGEDLLYAFEQ